MRRSQFISVVLLIVCSCELAQGDAVDFDPLFDRAVDLYTQYVFPNSQSRPDGFDLDGHLAIVLRRFEMVSATLHSPEGVAFLDRRMKKSTANCARACGIRILEESSQPEAVKIIRRYTKSADEGVADCALEALKRLEHPQRYFINVAETQPSQQTPALSSPHPVAAESRRGRSILETRNYKIIITANCPEGCVTCSDVTYEGLSKRSGKRITLKGSTWHTIGADGETPSRFLGYQFENGNITYIVTADCLLEVFKGDSNLMVEEQGTWSDGDDDLSNFIYAGRPIHPGCIREFEHALADHNDLPQSVVTVDVESSIKSNKNADAPEKRSDGYLVCKSTGDHANDWFAYKHIGQTSTGTHVLATASGGEGTIVAEDIYLVRFDTEVFFTSEAGAKHPASEKRLVLKCIGQIARGDRDDGTIELRGDTLVLGKSRYRSKPAEYPLP